MPFPVDAKWITQTEKKLGTQFPESFVVAMSKDNGGSVSTDVDLFWLFPFFDGSDRVRIKRTTSSIDRETASARTRPGFPRDAIAIGTNGGGDLLVLIPKPGRPESLQHAVFWWDHETDEVIHIADDFAELAKG